MKLNPRQVVLVHGDPDAVEWMQHTLSAKCLIPPSSFLSRDVATLSSHEFTGERKGRLIVFEGIDGTGKSTHIGHLRKYLEGKGLEVVQSFEPTRGRWGRMLRDSAVTGRLSVEEEVALFLKDRREHVETLIAPALARGAWVLLDRYYLSMMAYQARAA